MKFRHAFLLKLLPIKNNLFLGYLPKLKKSKIIIDGTNNILFCEKNVKLNNSSIYFNASNSLIYLSSGTYKINVMIFNDSVLYIGKDNYFNPASKPLTIMLSEGKNVFIGNNNTFSTDITIRNSDIHLLYDINTFKRINHTQSIYIGDHIWFGQNVMILKGSNIHSGSIIGARSVITSNPIYSNCVYAGTPANKIKENVFWEGSSCHDWTEYETKNHETHKSDEFIFSDNENAIPFNEIEENLNNCNSVYDKYLYLKGLPMHKNRFANLQIG